MPELSPESNLRASHAFKTGTIGLWIVAAVGVAISHFAFQSQTGREMALLDSHKLVECFATNVKPYKSRFSYEYRCEDGVTRMKSLGDMPETGPVTLFVSNSDPDMWLENRPTSRWVQETSRDRYFGLAGALALFCGFMVYRHVRLELRLRDGKGRIRHKGKLSLPTIQPGYRPVERGFVLRQVVDSSGRHFDILLSQDEFWAVEKGKVVVYYECSGEYFGADYFADIESTSENDRLRL